MRVDIDGSITLQDPGDRCHVVGERERRKRTTPGEHGMDELHRIVLGVGRVRSRTEHQQRGAREESIGHRRRALRYRVRVAIEKRFAGPIRGGDALVEEGTTGDGRFAVGSNLHTHLRSPLESL